MVGVAQLVERWLVVPDVAGSSPVSPPHVRRLVADVRTDVDATRRRVGSSPDVPWMTDRLERPGQPDELRRARVPHLLRLLPRGGRAAHAAGAPRGPRGRRHRPPRRDGTAHRGDARVRPVGDASPRTTRETRLAIGERIRIELDAEEAGLLTVLAHQFDEVVRDRRARRRRRLLARLFPDAYRDDPEAAAEFRRYTRDGLVEPQGANAAAARSRRSATRSRIELDSRMPPSDVAAQPHRPAPRWSATRLGIRDDDDDRTRTARRTSTCGSASCSGCSSRRSTGGSREPRAGCATSSRSS